MEMNGGRETTLALNRFKSLRCTLVIRLCVYRDLVQSRIAIRIIVGYRLRQLKLKLWMLLLTDVIGQWNFNNWIWAETSAYSSLSTKIKSKSWLMWSKENYSKIISTRSVNNLNNWPNRIAYKFKYYYPVSYYSVCIKGGHWQIIKIDYLCVPSSSSL